MKISTKALVVAGMLSVAAIAGIAQAQMPMEDHHGMSMHSGHERMGPGRMDKMVARHLDALKGKLKITATQEDAWKTFADAMKPESGKMGKHPDFAALKNLSTPERLDKMRELHKQHMAEREAAMDKRDAAIKAFYATLTADQKKVFDTEHARMEERGMGAKDHRGSAKGKPAAQPKPAPATKP